MGTTYPHVRVSGGARERGRQYGEQARDLVHRSVEAYADVYRARARVDWREAQETASAFAAPIRAMGRGLVEEIEGIAEGSALQFNEILALCVRSELIWSALNREVGSSTSVRAEGECTSIAILPFASASGHTLAARNWDWLPHAAETTIVLEVVQDHGPAFVTVTEAGLPAKSGFNSAGLALLTNALVSSLDSGSVGAPVHALARAVLDARTLPEALAVLQSCPRSASGNFMLVSRDGIAVDVETRPGGPSELAVLDDDRDVLVHTNHFLEKGHRWSDVGGVWSPDSYFRLRRARSLLDHRTEPVTIGMLQAILADHANHPSGVCTHVDPADPPADQCRTLASTIVDLDTCELWIADGNPCDKAFRHLDYSGFFASSEAGS